MHSWATTQPLCGSPALSVKSTLGSPSEEAGGGYISATPDTIFSLLMSLQLQQHPSPPLSPADLTKTTSSGFAFRPSTPPPVHPPLRSNTEQIQRTLFVSGLDSSWNEQNLASCFASCGSVVDCRISSDVKRGSRFGFIEFFYEIDACRALSLSGIVLRSSAIRVTPSKTAIVPVKQEYLPRSEEERGAVARTVYITNIHRAIERDALHAFFSMCGMIAKMRLLGGNQSATKIAFVEFSTLDSAAAALHFTGLMLGPLPIRVSASKTPVRTEPRKTGHQHAHQQKSTTASPWQRRHVDGAFPTVSGIWATLFGSSELA